VLTPPQVVVDNVSSVCSLGMRPHLMTGFLRQHLIAHFSQPDQIEHPNLREYLWRAEIERSKILIESLTQWKPENAGTRPAILIRRNAWQNQRMGIGDYLQGATVIEGHDRYSTLMQGSHTIFCLTTTPGECETLAAEVYRELLQFGPVIRETLSLMRFVLTEVGQMKPVLEAREHYATPVTVSYAHTEDWIIRRHAPVLDHIELSEFRP
jgi:hypothetical protein